MGISHSLLDHVVAVEKHGGGERLRIHIEAHVLEMLVGINPYGVVDGVTLFVHTDGLAVHLVKLLAAAAEHHVAEDGVVVFEIVDEVGERGGGVDHV